MSVVIAHALGAGYDGRIVTTVDSLAMAAGDRLAFTGPNGSGKTTVLKTLAGLLPRVSGELTAPRPGPGGAIYVHPSPFLFAGTGIDNVMLGAHGDRDAASRAIDAMRAASFGGADVRTLSHGQRQRIALARAIAARPVLLLVDEPETGLDAEGLEAWRALLRDRSDIAVITATHHLRDGARAYALAAR